MVGESAKDQRIGRRDRLHLEAAEGWLGLGDYSEANEELERISPRVRAHAEALRLRCFVYEGAKKWELAADVAQALCNLLPETPFGWMHLAYALHEMKRTREAREVLLPMVDKFSDEHIIAYRLACYSCQLGELKDAWGWLRKAIDMTGKKDIRMMALDDPDLEPLWLEIAEI